jgi:hypothetical protein
MATVKVVLTEYPNAGAGEAYIASWPLMLNGDVGEPLVLHGYHDRSVQVEGTIGAAGSVTIEGSNDKTNYETINDPSSTALTFTSLAKIKGILEAVYQMRPHVTAGDGTTSITVTAYLRKTVK